MDHGQLEHPIEQHAAATGAAAVEAEHELVEVVAHVGTVGGPLMRPQQPSLGQRDDAVHGGHQPVGIVTSRTGRALAASIVADGVRLSWTTHAEFANQGFHIHRAALHETGPPAYRRITADLIPGSGTATGDRTYSFTDTEVDVGTSYGYTLTAVTVDGREIAYGTRRLTATPQTSIGEEHRAPAAFALRQNRPNPFNASTVIEYELPQRADVTLTIYDVLGQPVRAWTRPDQPPGRYGEMWDGTDWMGEGVSSGTYIYRLRTEGFAATRRMILLH